ncbi:MAG: PD-(D/E)XK nuclease family protein [Lachnospiraceae bacterium]|nr:PD-(D/E)XK nuclease family protein [Lachnospiraceae bacterium]
MDEFRKEYDMAVQFILGGSGTGKTRYLYEHMIQDSMTEGHPPVIFMLPEQSNMAAEQDMVSLHPMGGTMDISILSFTRLAFQVFDELNIHTRDILDDYGKSMLIMKLLKAHQNELSYYGAMVGKQGFVDEVKSILSEFYQYQITDEVLSGVIAQLSPDKSLYHKLSDLQILLKAFDEAMKDSYMVTEQILTLLKEVAGESALLRKADIYFDGFTGFTPVQYGVIEEMMKLGGNLYFSFTMEESLFGRNDYGEQGLFHLAKESVDRLCKLAQDNRIAVLPHVGQTSNYRLGDREALLHLEQQLFRFPDRPYKKETDEIRIVAAVDSREEISLVAGMIKKYVMEQGYHYRDFAVITGDLKEQSVIWKQVMEQRAIPYFMDFSETLSHNPMVEMIGMVMELFRSDFSYDSVFSFLKTGFLEIGMEEIYALENYALKYGVRGYHWWASAFRGNVKGLKEYNATRKKFMDRIEPVAPVFLKRTASAKEYMEALYQFLADNQMAEKLYAKSGWLETQGNLREAKAYSQVYEKFIAVLDKTMALLGEEEVEREHFMEILMAGIADMQLGVIPSTLDQVMIGDMERSRLHHVRVLFVTGTNEGLIPKNASGQGILADKDREELKDRKLQLAPGIREEMLLQQYYWYLQITQASEQLFITYRQSDEKGAQMRPSYFINRILHVFPMLQIVRAGELSEGFLPTTRAEVTAGFADGLSEEKMEDSSLYKIMEQECPEVLRDMVAGFFYDNRAGVLNRTIARRLYGEHMVHSVSRLETYAGCAYQFFLQFGLKLRKREEYKVETTHIGTILHAVMEQFFGQVRDGAIVPGQMKQEELDRVVEELTIRAAKEENETIFESSFRNRHQLDVLVRVARRSIANLCRHLEQGSMQPAYFEEKFSPENNLHYINMALEEDMRMELNGIVDRVDIRETEDAVYVKVIDYKSGVKDIDYVKMYEGKQLQLTVYMSVMLELLQREYPDKKIIPTGMYYYHIYDPIIEELEATKREQKRIESSRLSGLVNDDEQCLELMDGKTGLVTPVRYKKDGSLDSRNQALVSTQELQQISEFVRKKMIGLGEQILRGEIEMNPEKGEIHSPCNICDYKDMCRFEAGLGGNQYRIGSQLDKGEAKEKILHNEKMEEGDNQ